MNWTTALQKVLAQRGDTVPAGWLTAIEVGKEWDKGRAMTTELLAVMVEQGKAERRSFKVVRNGARRTVPHYRLK